MAFDWNIVFKQAGQIKSADEAATLLNRIGDALGLLHFRLEDSNIVLAGSVGGQTPSPLRAEATFVFDELREGRSTVLTDRLQQTNEPFWLDSTRSAATGSSPATALLCCPVRYGRSEQTYALFLAKPEMFDDRDAACLQMCLIRVLERMLALGILLKRKSEPLNEREKACLDMYSNGNSIAQIAEKLDLHEQAVVSIMNVSRSRLLANNLSHAIAVAIRAGII